MSEIKTLSEMPECCCVCGYVDLEDMGCWIDKNHQWGDGNSVNNWCERFEPAAWVKDECITLTTPKLFKETK